MKQCNHCGKWKDEEEINWRFKTLGIRHPTCRECAHKHNKKYFEGDAKKRHLQQVKERKLAVREAAREYVWNYLSTHPCENCGESDPRVLEFHHVQDKEHPISLMTAGGYPIWRIEEEIKKCKVLCANFHRNVTMRERGWFRGRK